VLSHHQVARDAAEAGLTRLVGAPAMISPLVAIVQVLANSRDYSPPVAAIVVWLAVLGAGARLVPRLREGALSRGEVAAAITIPVATVAALGAVHRATGAPGGVDLGILGTVWLLVLVVMTRRARVWIPAGLLLFGVQSAVLIRGEGVNPLGLSELAGAGYIITAVLIAFAALRPALAAHASVAARQASLASRSAAERAAALAIQQERRGRLAVLEKQALPLLRAIADGTLDPASEDVRRECARHAAALRRSLADGAPLAGGLVAALEPALRAAAARGVPVIVQQIGDPGTVRPAFARALLSAVDAVLGALAPQQVTLTVLACDDDVELYLTFGAPLPTVPDLTRLGQDVPAAAHWRARVSANLAGGGCLEVRWRRERS
jgi:hypothetical protein